MKYALSPFEHDLAGSTIVSFLTTSIIAVYLKSTDSRAAPTACQINIKQNQSTIVTYTLSPSLFRGARVVLSVKDK
jgi:hypothetical protein